MVITLADWQFSVDVEKTKAHTIQCSMDHCTCAYCRNYYETIDRGRPNLRPVMNRFGVTLDGPSELMPIEPTLVIACYRVYGQILQTGNSLLYVDHVPVRPEPADDCTFFLWIGAAEVPWVQDEPVDEVISPANQPEFMDRMMQKLLEWAGEEDIVS